MAPRLHPSYASGEHTTYHLTCASQTYREKVVPWERAQGVHVTFQISSPLVFRTAMSQTPESVICGHFGLLEIATCLGILSNGGGLKKRKER